MTQFVELIDVACPLCSATEAEPYATENGYRLIRCKACGLLYVTPRPNPDTTAAAHQYGLHQGDIAIEVTGRYRPSRIRTYGRILKEIYGNAMPAGSSAWLDIGCGHGEFLEAVSRFIGRRPCQLIGLEPNHRKVAGCVERGLDVRTCGLKDVPGSFAGISLLNVFSHLQDPKEFLRECVSRLDPSGELLIETGDTAHLPAERHPRPLYLPDHLSFANRTIVIQLLKDLGLEVVSVHNYSVASAIPWPVAKECQSAIRSRRWPKPLVAMRHWWRERHRAVDMYIRARRRS